MTPLSARLPGRAWWAAVRPTGMDVMGAAAVAAAVVAGTAVAAAAEGPVSPLRDLAPGGYLLAGAGGLALAFRNTAPTTTFAVTLGLSVAYQAASYPGGPDPLPVVLALYTLAAHGHRLRSLGLGLGAVVALVTVRGLVVGDTYSTPLIVLFPTTVVAALFLGQLMTVRRTRRLELEQREAYAARERENDTRRQVDAERLRIARELHDVVAHGISLINVQATMGVHLMATRPEEAAAALNEIKTASKQALRELRRVLDVLRQSDDDDPTAPTPGLAQLDALVATTRQAGLPVSLLVTGTPAKLPAIVDTAAYRIVQESLTNALRYADSATTRVLLDYQPTCLHLRIEDDGRNIATQQGGSGHGISGMRERAVAVGGSLTAEAAAPGGFAVSADLPLPRPA